MAKVLVPKVQKNEKINIRMEEKRLKTNVEWALCDD
jgi:hypothetical protein